MRLIDADKLKAHYAWWNDENKELFDQIVDVQPTVEQKEWISVKEKLPPLEENVLAVTQYGEIGIAEMYASNKWDFADDWLKDNDVIYWAQLPKPPKEDK